MEQAIPGLEDITPAWLTGVLRAAGLTRTSVARVDKKLVPAGSGGGHLSDLVWLRLSYHESEPGTPASLVLKLPATAGPASAGTVPGLLIGYRVEVAFYRDLAAHIPLRVPRCYFAACDEASGRFALLLEDLSGLRGGDDLAGCSYEEAAAAVEAAARMHSRWWDASEEERPTLPARNVVVPPSFDAELERLQRDFAGRLPAVVFSTSRRLFEKFGALRRELTSPPTTLVHFDFRLDNIFFAPARDGANGPEPLVLDWQLMQYARGLQDVSFFLGESLPVEGRRIWEEPLLRLYHARLQDSGIDYDFNACVRDYRLGLLQNHFRWLRIYRSFSEIPGPESARAAQMLMRSAASISDFDAPALLEELAD